LCDSSRILETPHNNTMENPTSASQNIKGVTIAPLSITTRDNAINSTGKLYSKGPGHFTRPSL